jgi:hypothetical protein
MENDKRTNNIKAKKMTKRQTILWPTENDKRTNNIMATGKRKKDKQYNGQRKTINQQTL